MDSADFAEFSDFASGEEIEEHDYFPKERDHYEELSDKLQDRVNMRNDVRVVRSVDKITKDTSNDVDVTVDIKRLDACIVNCPSNNAEFRMFCKNLLIISNTLYQAYVHAVEQNIPPSVNDLNIVNRVSKNLLGVLIDDSNIISQQHAISSQDSLEYFRPDILCFKTYLQCIAFINLSPKIKNILKRMTIPNTFKSLAKLFVIPPDYARSQVPVSSYNAADLSKCLARLESFWTSMEYSETLLDYIETIVSTVSYLYVMPRSKQSFGFVSDYYTPLTDAEDSLCIMTDKLVEDICWSVVPMYKKLFVRGLIYERLNLSEHHIPKDYIKTARNFFIKNTRDMLNKSLTEHFRNIYIPMSIRPSERNRFARDYRGKSMVATDIVRKMRIKEYMKTLMENFDEAPWTIMEEKRLDNSSREVMLMLMIDSFVSNILGINWMDEFVDFNIYILSKGTDYINTVDKRYPRIIQDFNLFNLIHDGKIYQHNSAASSFLQWLDIMNDPPYNGKYQASDVWRVKTSIAYIFNASQ